MDKVSIRDAIASICEDICMTTNVEENRKRAEAVALLALAEVLCPSPDEEAAAI